MGDANRDLIAGIIRDGKAGELVDLLLGDDPARVSGEPIFSSADARDAYVMTVENLRFIDKFGEMDSPVKEGGKIYFSYPDYFEKWFQLGTPGLTQDDLLSYLSKRVS